MAEILRINHLLDRKTAKLSGGEMQRVSIGRAIVRQPRIFLMDEPLSNLDAKLREALRVELQHMQKTQGNTTLFVTHDQIEALTMADRIGVLNEGRLVQVGTPVDIYDRPATTFVAQLVGIAAHQPAAGRAARTARSIVDDSRLQMPVPAGRAAARQAAGGHSPGRHLSSIRRASSAAQVVLTEPLGVETILHMQSGEQTLLSLVPGMIHLQRGDTVRFNILQTGCISST